MAGRKFSDEYKREAVSLTPVPGATIQGVPRVFGAMFVGIDQRGNRGFPRGDPRER
jgi:transposase-like protein